MPFILWRRLQLILYKAKPCRKGFHLPFISDTLLKDVYSVYKACGGIHSLCHGAQLCERRYFNEMSTAALETLYTLTFVPACRSALLSGVVHDDLYSRSPMCTLLSAASGQDFRFDLEVGGQQLPYSLALVFL